MATLFRLDRRARSPPSVATTPPCSPRPGRRRDDAVRGGGHPLRLLHEQIERAFAEERGVLSARVNLTAGRLAVSWPRGAADPDRAIALLDRLGFRAHPFRPEKAADAAAAEQKRLLRALGVAGFAMMNVMLLSVSVWSGHTTGLSPETRDFFHWISALIALPTAAYSGRPFFESAIGALKARAVNMDVPISLGILLALGLSVVETLNHGEHAYFDGAVMLIFFLLLGRVLDQ